MRMRMSRVLNVLVVLAAAFLLSGCYVYALVPPASEDGPVDHRLSGTWSVLDKQGKPSGVFLHFIVPGDGGPMRLLTTESASYGVFEFYSVPAGNTQVFAIRKLPGGAAGRATIPAADNTKFLLGTYRIKDDTLLVYSYDAGKFRAAIASGKIRGRVAAGQSPPVLLTGTANALTQALSTPEAQSAVSAEPYPIARRAHQ